MRIWFNHWFSTAYNLIKQLKEKDNTLTIIGSSHKDFMTYKLLCDEWYKEPIDETTYVDWCINFCKEKKIDIFIPRTKRTLISKEYKRFSDIGVRVMVDDNYELIEMLEDKVKTIEFCEKYNICNTPEICTVTNVNEFKEKYNYLKSKYFNDNICMKYAKDEGGLSFRVITEGFSDISSLKQYQGPNITYDKAIEILKSTKSFEPLILMVYMNGIEVSVDSLMTQKGFVGCARYKEGSKVTKIVIDSPLIEISKKFAEITNIKRPYNMQFIYHNNKAYLLEVNTRMAGGTYKTGFSGINFPYLAYCDLAELNYDLPTNTKNVTLTTIESPLLIN